MADQVPEVSTFIRKSGWDPFEPSDECVEATRRTELPSPALTDFDRLAIHRSILLVTILTRFPKIMKRWRTDALRAVHCAAALHAVRASGVDLGTFPNESYQQLLVDLREWEDGRLKESDRRIREVGEIIEGEWREDFEPALSLMWLTCKQGCTDFGGSRKAFRMAMKLGENRGVPEPERKEIHDAIHKLPIDDDQVGLAIEMILDDNPSRHLFYITKAGKIRLGAEEAREAMEHVAGEEVAPVREERGVPLPDDAAEQEAHGGHADELAAFEAFRAFRRTLEDDRERLDDDEPMALAIDHFEDLEAREVTILELASRAGVDRERLGAAYKVLRDRLQKFLRGQGPEK